MSNLFGDFFDGDFNDTDITWGGTWEGMPEYNNSRQPSPEITATFKFKNHIIFFLSCYF